jgi:tellurite resistance protein TerC
VGGVAEHSLTAWVLFNVMVLAFLALDLGVINRKAHEVTFRDAVFWNVVWTALGLLFGLLVARLYGRNSGVEYLTGYVIERALSIDNIFVFVVVFRYFSVPPQYQHRVLYWGILGALGMRAALIFTGSVIVGMFHWVLYLFGAFLVYTGIMLLVKDEAPPDPERNPAVRLARRLFPVTPEGAGKSFFVRRGGKIHATPLLIVLLVVETTDLVFALDSIPAIFGITRDPFIIYTSNVFAILGLRAMYFLLAALLPRFRYLKHGLSAVLVFIGARMLSDDLLHVPTAAALLAVVAILAIAVAASMLAGSGKASGEDDAP